MCWDVDYGFDEKIYAENIKGIIADNVDGIYTTGSTGEFYALEYDEFCSMVDIQADLCGRSGMPLQIGCCSDATQKTIRMLEYVAAKEEVGAAQIAIPYWMELTDRELLKFFSDLHVACPGMPLVHYNNPRSKRYLGAEDYLRILQVAPNLIGVKFGLAGSNFGALQDAIWMVPQLSYFVGETLLASGMQLGARGSYIALIATNPVFMKEMYAVANNGQWEKAIQMQIQVAQFYARAVPFILERGEGVIDPVFDKGLAVAAGYINGHQRCRPPYIGWSDETVIAMRTWLKENYPMLVYIKQNESSS